MSLHDQLPPEIYSNKKFSKNSGFINLEDNEQLIYKSNKTPILITSKEKAKAFFESNENFTYYKMLVLHNPDDFDSVKEFNFDLVIAGHNLNGYIGIPKIKDFFQLLKQNIDEKHYTEIK